MHDHNIETPRPRAQSDDTEVPVTPVGTFAEGQQCAQGPIPVVIGAEVGSFASGQEDDRTQESE